MLDTEAFYNATNLVCRVPFLFVQQLEGINLSTLSLATTQVVKMKANTADAPYVIQKGAPTHWQFNLTYATVDQFLIMAHEQLAASRLPYADRKEALQVHKSAQCKSCQLREQTLDSKMQVMSTLIFQDKRFAMPLCFSNREICLFVFINTGMCSKSCSISTLHILTAHNW